MQLNLAALWGTNPFKDRSPPMHATPTSYPRETRSRRRHRTLTHAVVAALLSGAIGVGASAPATAETATRKDPQQNFSQGPALDLEAARLQFGKRKLVFVLHIEKLSKKRTQVFGTLSLPSYLLRVSTKFDANGNKKVIGTWSGSDGQGRFTDGVSADWDWRKNTITLTISQHLRGQQGLLAAYTVAKGALHGPPRGDFIAARLQRG